ncbi:hypothetical protein DNTS_002130 [Danionella cerebrum]|uniref:Uncharacterized protein n=1 Tax=Danionella cerebrum TaxID=2873325 RepID=A0A553MKR3_9TELE|nr:hypothetical protein DNTS_002130 [Danionella translucida]
MTHGTSDDPTDPYNLPVMSNGVLEDPPVAGEPNSHQGNTEYFPVEMEMIPLTDQTDDRSLTEHGVQFDEQSDLHYVQTPISPNVLLSNENHCVDSPNQEEEKEPSEIRGDDVKIKKNTSEETGEPLRRSERTREPPKRLDYTELGTPLITAVKRQGASTTHRWCRYRGQQAAKRGLHEDRVVRFCSQPPLREFRRVAKLTCPVQSRSTVRFFFVDQNFGKKI